MPRTFKTKNGFIPERTIYTYFKGISPEIRNNIPPEKLLKAWDFLLNSRMSRSKTRPNDFIENKYLKVFKKIGITDELFEEAEKNMETHNLNKLEIDSRRAVIYSVKILHKFLNDFFIENKCSEEVFGELTPTTMSSFLYAFWKESLFSWANDQMQPIIDSIVEKGVTWLLSAGVFIQDGNLAGWDEQPINKGITPSLRDSAIVLNHLIRIRTNFGSSKYEAVLLSLLTWFDKEKSLWKNSDDKIDFRCSCLALRTISNYLSRRQGKLDIKNFKLLQKLRDKVIIEILNLQNENGSWNSNDPEVSDQAATAIALHALRSSDMSRESLSIINGCEWLLNRVHFSLSTKRWGWLKETDNGLVPDLYETSLIVSSLLRSSYYSRFVVVEDVINWIIVEVENPTSIFDHEYATVVCTLGDYYRAIQIKEFFMN